MVDGFFINFHWSRFRLRRTARRWLAKTASAYHVSQKSSTHVACRCCLQTNAVVVTEVGLILQSVAVFFKNTWKTTCFILQFRGAFKRLFKSRNEKELERRWTRINKNGNINKSDENFIEENCKNNSPPKNSTVSSSILKSSKYGSQKILKTESNQNNQEKIEMISSNKKGF